MWYDFIYFFDALSFYKVLGQRLILFTYYIYYDFHSFKRILYNKKLTMRLFTK